MRRVAVTGIGVVSPLGNSAAEVYRNAHAGRSGVRRLDVPFGHGVFTTIAATSQCNSPSNLEPSRLRMLDRVSVFALVAANQALLDSHTDLSELDRERAGVFVGTGMGGSHSIDEAYQALYSDGSERVKPFAVLMSMHNAPAAWIGIEHGLRGPNLTYSTACSSSAVAIGEAWLRVASGAVDFAVAGGAETPLSVGSIKGWEALRTLAAIDAEQPWASCKPFAKNRSGLVLGEGAAMLVLEPWDRAVARGVPLHGEIAGYGLTNDASHITQPGADGQAAAMRAALESAALKIEAIDAINAHGTATRANDITETAAIRAVFGERAKSIPISATKALHGHLLGAAGALECVLSLLAMQNKVALPTMHLQMPDPECDLDYVPNIARSESNVRTMLSNSFAFGGSNAVLVLRAAS